MKIDPELKTELREISQGLDSVSLRVTLSDGGRYKFNPKIIMNEIEHAKNRLRSIYEQEKILGPNYIGKENNS